jgi:hypothetical protein
VAKEIIKMNKILIAATYLLCTTAFIPAAKAQQPFVEGVIVYSVSIGPVAGSAGFTEHAGTYTLTLKGASVRKELRMNSGYQNVIIENNNTGSVYSLQAAAGQNYAIQLRAQDVDEKMKPYEGFSQKDEDGTMTIAGQPCTKATIRYKDGSASSLYYTTAWSNPTPSLFERFPAIKYIPLSFEYRNDEGITMHFAAEKLEARPVESSLFRVPPDFKIISNAEYKSMRK